MSGMKNFKHPDGRIREAPQGFSWTCLFFGCFVPLCRGHWIPFIISVFVCIFLAWTIIAPIIVWFVLAFGYNDMYTSYLKKEGFVEVQSDNDSVTAPITISNTISSNGNSNGINVLNEQDAVGIINLISNSNLSNVEIGEMCNVSEKTVENVKSGRLFPNLDRPWL